MHGSYGGTRRTIALNIANNNYVRIAGDIYRGDLTSGSAPMGYRDGLGIAAYDTVIGGEIPRLGDTNPLYLYSLMITGRRDVFGGTRQRHLRKLEQHLRLRPSQLVWLLRRRQRPHVGR